jgi:hypothetical protein
VKFTIVRAYNLTTALETKCEDACIFGWTALVNNRGTLIHIVRHDFPLIIRVNVPNMKSASNEYISNYLSAGVGRYLRR